MSEEELDVCGSVLVACSGVSDGVKLGTGTEGGGGGGEGGLLVCPELARFQESLSYGRPFGAASL
jgi:hypothetical protein